MTSQLNKNCQRKYDFTFIWAIENGSELLVSLFLTSPRFTAHSMKRTKWRLMVDRDLYYKTLSLGIQREDDNDSIVNCCFRATDSIEIEYELSLLATDGSPLGTKTSKKQFTGTDYCLVGLFEDSDEVFFQRRAEFLPNDTLTVRCRMRRTGTEISKPDSCFARTRLGVDRRSIVWDIKEFSNLRPGQKRTLFVNPTSNGSPQLQLSLFLSERNGKTYVSVQIDQNYAKMHHGMFCKLSLLDSEGRVSHSEKIWEFIQLNRRQICTIHEFFEKDKLVNDDYSLLQKDVLSLKCEFLIEADPVWKQREMYRHLH
ncbi:hypothetical protein AVEN_76580-1 [Araneus ventricosus]|uniref:MATH domain-containing protein n=1 Tax=Araneus ventricosus TaxID=182803 RepID=A0A4Y2NG12_ARAVE|nr:hypothetical protein AVEN_76580-1 [Araneus ventricosus]